MKQIVGWMACGALLIAAAACGDDGGGEGGSGGTSSGTATGTGGTAGTGSGTATGTGGAGGSGGIGGAAEGGGGSGGSMCTGMGELMFGETCECDDQCASGLCYPFGMGASCTIPCPPNPDDCPNNGKGCNNMAPAVCKT